MLTLRWPTIATGLAALLLLATAGTAESTVAKSDHPQPGHPALPRLLAKDAAGSAAEPAGGAPFIGADGLLYDFAAMVVGGLDGQVFFGPDYDTACADGAKFEKGLHRLAKLAKVIESTGRRVILTVAPNKTSIYSNQIDWANLPHGECTRLGLAQQDEVLDDFDYPSYLPLRRALVKDQREMYWKTDTHWTSVGSSVFAERLASKLDERLGRKQRYTITQQEFQGDLFSLLGIPQPETAQAAVPANKVSVSIGPTDPLVELQQTWRSSPRKKTLPGHTVVVGDSYSYVGLGTLRPLFRHGHFVWIQAQNLDYIAQSLVDADTVVIEVVQRFVSSSVIGTPAFRHQVKRALR
jgi:SGNH hydrolase-like domain, acetyltransferase AlgX